MCDCEEKICDKTCDKTPASTENPKSNMTTHKRHQNLRLHNDYGLTWTVSWSNNSYPTGVVKLYNGIPTFPQQLCNQGYQHAVIIYL